jgi:recombination protein RecT
MSANINTLTWETKLTQFNSDLKKYETSIINLLGKKYGISPEEFMVKTINAIKKHPKLLKCNTPSLFGSILYFAELGLSFNTPEGFGFIVANETKPGFFEAEPLIGYQGLIEIAYRNPKVKSIRFQSVYQNDEFDYEYGTEEYIKHKPSAAKERGFLTHAYAVAKLEGMESIFVVVHKRELDKIQKLSKSSRNKGFHDSEADVFNIMYAKSTIKLLCKMLPKTNNEVLLKVLDIDNQLDFGGKTTIVATDTGYEIVETKSKKSATEKTEMPIIDVATSNSMKELQDGKEER